MKKILIIQTAFIGDVILATPLIEAAKERFPNGEIHFLLRKGNEGLFQGHPKIDRLWIWDKKENKYKNLFSLLKKIREEEFDEVITCQRYASSGFLTAFSKAKHKAGFKQNPFSIFFDHKVLHEKYSKHEVYRNLELFRYETLKKPKLYPPKIENLPEEKYVCMAPASVWFTKQLPKGKWVELCNKMNPEISIILLGGPSDKALCDEIQSQSKHPKIINKAGELSLLESVGWIKDATMNYVNDSAPLHMASSVNAPCTAFFCSTGPEFGFYPLSDDSKVIQVENLDCKPCGLVGKKACPKGHFKCGKEIKI